MAGIRENTTAAAGESRGRGERAGPRPPACLTHRGSRPPLADLLWWAGHVGLDGQVVALLVLLRLSGADALLLGVRHLPHLAQRLVDGQEVEGGVGGQGLAAVPLHEHDPRRLGLRGGVGGGGRRFGV